MQLSYYCFKDRKKRKMPLDTPLNTKNFKLKDKLGLNIKEQIEICNKYGIIHKLYVKRKEKGWSLKEILKLQKETSVLNILLSMISEETNKQLA